MSNHRCVDGNPMAVVPIVVGIAKLGITLTKTIWEMTSTNDYDELIGAMSDLSHRIDSLEQNSMLLNTIGIMIMPKQIRTQMLLIDHLRDIDEPMGKIGRKYNLLKHYINETITFENFTLVDFATHCVSSHDGLTENLQKLHALIIPDKNGFKNHNFIKLLSDDLKVSYILQF